MAFKSTQLAKIKQTLDQLKRMGFNVPDDPKFKQWAAPISNDELVKYLTRWPGSKLAMAAKDVIMDPATHGPEDFRDTYAVSKRYPNGTGYISGADVEALKSLWDPAGVDTRRQNIVNYPDGTSRWRLCFGDDCWDTTFDRGAAMSVFPLDKNGKLGTRVQDSPYGEKILSKTRPNSTGQWFNIDSPSKLGGITSIEGLELSQRISQFNEDARKIAEQNVKNTPEYQSASPYDQQDMIDREFRKVKKSMTKPSTWVNIASDKQKISKGFYNEALDDAQSFINIGKNESKLRKKETTADLLPEAARKSIKMDSPSVTWRSRQKQYDEYAPQLDTRTGSEDSRWMHKAKMEADQIRVKKENKELDDQRKSLNAERDSLQTYYRRELQRLDSLLNKNYNDQVNAARRVMKYQ